MTVSDNAALQSALVFGQYSLCHYATDLTAVLRDLRRLSRSKNHPSAALDPVIARVTRLRAEARPRLSKVAGLLNCTALPTPSRLVAPSPRL